MTEEKRAIPKARKQEKSQEPAPPTHNQETSLTLYAIYDYPPPVVPAMLKRDWMENTPDRFAYRCLPLNIANGLGWDILCTVGFSGTWDGGVGLDSIVIKPLDGKSPVDHLVQSHFGSGVLTLHPGYLMRTPPGLDILITGSLNNPKHGIAPLAGLVETYWLPFTFTMNWKFTAPGTVTFEKGEPFCTIIPFPHTLLDSITPEIYSINDNPELKAGNENWAKARSDFNQRLHDQDPETVAQGWQRDYFRGQIPWDSKYTPDQHKNKLRLNDPVDKRKK